LRPAPDSVFRFAATFRTFAAFDAHPERIRVLSAFGSLENGTALPRHEYDPDASFRAFPALTGRGRAARPVFRFDPLPPFTLRATDGPGTG
jgi:hypothetical protein